MKFFFTFSLCITFLCFSEERRLLEILSCGGGGTLYMTKCLQKGGLRVGHEGVGPDGYVGWPFVAGFYSWTGDSAIGAEFDHVFHQVRNPLRVIQTWMKEIPPSRVNSRKLVWHFIQRSIPEVSENDSLVVKCAKYWFYWNKKAEEKSEWRFKVEEFTDKHILDEFEMKLGLILDREKILTIPNNYHSWEGEIQGNVTWEMLEENLPRDLFDNIREMAYRYGYPIED